MIRLFFSLTVMILFAGSLFAQQVQVPPGSIEIKEVKINILDTPQYNVSGDSKRVPNARKWIEIETHFMSKLPYIPELTFDYYVALDVKQTQAVMTGSVTHISITEGSELYSSMYISPGTIAAVLGGRSSFRPNIIDQATVRITYQGTPLAESSLNAQPPSPWWTSLRQMTGLLLAKNETPFAPLWWDRYEAIKPSGR